MKHLATILAILLSTTPFFSYAQTAMTSKQLNYLCDKMDAEITSAILKTKDSIAPSSASFAFNRMDTYPFLRYLSVLYKDSKQIFYLNTNTVNGELVRISEGLIDTATINLGSYPENMLETSYYFLNNQLVRICVSKGVLDYNSHPALFYNVYVYSSVFIFKNDKLAKLQSFIEKDGKKETLSQQVQSNWKEDTSLDDNMLKERAFELFGMYKSSSLKSILL